ncbi:MXAN_6640 family putative metalloprotease [Nocardioides dilutus]
MPHSALSRAAATMVTVVALIGATLAAPSAVAADRGDLSGDTSSRAANQALSRAQTALTGKGGDATMALRDLWLQRDNLSAADRAAYAKLAGRPVKPETMALGNIRIHYNSLEMNPAAFSPNDVLNTSVSVAQAYAGAGYRQPLPDGSLGGDSLTDIYVDTLPQGLYGYCTTDQKKQTGPGRFDVWAYCVVDNDYAGFPLTPIQNLQVTVAHEYFHATQFAYDIADDGWAMEATAAWAEDELYDGVNDNVQYLADSPITDRKRSIDKFGGLFHYGVWIWFRYLTEKFRAEKGGMPKIILDFWKAADSSKGAKKDKYFTQGMAQVLKKRPYKSSVDKEFALFSAANQRAPLFYEEGAANNYPTAKINGKKKLNKGQAKAFTAKLDHLSAAAYRFTPKGKAKKLQVAIAGAPKVQGTRAVVTTYLANGKVKTKYVAINAKGRGAVTVGFKKSAVNFVDVTLVNASVRFTQCYVRSTPFSCSGKPTDQDKRITVLSKAV